MRTSYCEKQEADVEEGELLGALALSPEEEGGSQPLPALGLGSVSESYWSRRLSHSLPAPHPTARGLGAAHGLPGHILPLASGPPRRSSSQPEVWGVAPRWHGCPTGPLVTAVPFPPSSPPHPPTPLCCCGSRPRKLRFAS